MALSASVMASGRKQADVLAAIIKQHRADVDAAGQGEVVDCAVSAVLDNVEKTTFFGEIDVFKDGTGEILGTYQIARNDGRLMSFSDVDSFASKAIEIIGSKSVKNGRLDVKIKGADALIKPVRVPRNIIADAEKKLDKYSGLVDELNAQLAEYDVELNLMSGWENGDDNQQARKAETISKKDAVLVYKEYLQSEIARIDAIVNPQP